MERTQWALGPHLLEFEPPDVLHCHARGTVLASEMQEGFRIMQEEVIPKVGDVYFIVYLREVGAEAIPKETQKHLLSIDPPWKGAVVIGGTSITRMAANIFAHTMTILTGKKRLMRVVNTQEEALSLVSEWRSASTGGR
jgi:hypothetical protein